GNRGLGQTYSVFSANSANTVHIQRDDTAILFKTGDVLQSTEHPLPISVFELTFGDERGGNYVELVISRCKVQMSETFRLRLNDVYYDKSVCLRVLLILTRIIPTGTACGGFLWS
ncbi:3598_t:CDS:1, partial [Paraglomus occultum]